MPVTNPALADIDSISSDRAQVLASLGYFDAEQLLGAASVEGMNQFMAEALGLSRAELGAMLDAVQQVADIPMKALRQGALGPLGALPPTDEMRKEIARSAVVHAAPAALPSSVSHIGALGPIRDQGGRGTCVAFAASAVHEMHRRSLGAIEDLSEQFLYHQTKLIDGSPNCGTWQMRALQVLETLGECAEAVWPYNDLPPCNNNGVEPGNARADAALRKCAPVIIDPRDALAAKSLLAQGKLVGVSIPVYDSWYRSSAVRKTGRLTMRIGGEPGVGGHAMCLVGYQDNAAYPGGGFFVLRNSWGTAWAPESAYGPGYGTIPYAYIANDGWELISVS